MTALKGFFWILRFFTAKLTNVTIGKSSGQFFALCIVSRTNQKVVIRMARSSVSFRPWFCRVNQGWVFILESASRRWRQGYSVCIGRLAKHYCSIFEFVGKETDADCIVTFNRVLVTLTSQYQFIVDAINVCKCFSTLYDSNKLAKKEFINFKLIFNEPGVYGKGLQAVCLENKPRFTLKNWTKRQFQCRQNADQKWYSQHISLFSSNGTTHTHW